MFITEGEDGELYIDIEEALQAVLAVTADEEMKQKILHDVAQNTGLPLDDVEEVTRLFMETLLEMSRSN